LYLPTETEIKLLSQKEIEYLRSPESFNANYKYFLKHQIKNKVKSLSDELMLLSDAGFLNNLSETSKSLRDFNKISKNDGKLENRSFSQKSNGSMVGLPGFEPESIEPKSTSLDQASRQPRSVAGKDNFCCIIKTLAKPCLCCSVGLLWF
jgi:hypothetical protein